MSEDCLNIDRLVEAMYECMSFEANRMPDYERFRGLFCPGANLFPPSDDEIGVSAVSVEEFIETSQATLQRSQQVAESGFTEMELHRVTQRFESVVQLFSTYESRVVLDEEVHTSRGVNALQLIWQSQRWWILSLAWDDETPDRQVPLKYLPQR
jgi:hypothetical protein